MTGHPPSDRPTFGKGVDVMFPGNKRNVGCYLTRLSRAPPPPLPGGYAVGDRVFYTGASQTCPSGDKLTHGQPGEVKGPSSTKGDKGVAVMFPGNKGNIGCYLTKLSRTPPPPLPGGYALGEKVYFTGDSETVSTGDTVTRGQAGEVTGHPPNDRPIFGKGVAVMFPGNKGPINCPITMLSRTRL